MLRNKCLMISVVLLLSARGLASTSDLTPANKEQFTASFEYNLSNTLQTLGEFLKNRKDIKNSAYSYRIIEPYEKSIVTLAIDIASLIDNSSEISPEVTPDTALRLNTIYNELVDLYQTSITLRLITREHMDKIKEFGKNLNSYK